MTYLVNYITDDIIVNYMTDDIIVNYITDDIISLCLDTLTSPLPTKTNPSPCRTPRQCRLDTGFPKPFTSSSTSVPVRLRCWTSYSGPPDLLPSHRSCTRLRLVSDVPPFVDVMLLSDFVSHSRTVSPDLHDTTPRIKTFLRHRIKSRSQFVLL